MSRNILVIGGGQSAEHGVSLATAAQIGDALRGNGFAVGAVTIRRDGIWSHGGRALGPTPRRSVSGALALFDGVQAVFPAVHGPLGEDGTLAALCALTHTPMVGSPLSAGAMGMNKWVTKLVAEACGLRTARYRHLIVPSSGAPDHEALAAAERALNGDLVVKPVAAGSSYGVSLARGIGQLAAAVQRAARFDEHVLIEEAIVGRELDVAVLREADGTRWAAPPLEIRARGLFDTASKYDGSAPFSVPASLTRDDVSAITDAAFTMFDALGCGGVARVDFFLTELGLVLNEVNTLPGMTVDSQVPRMFAAAGVGYSELLSRLVAGARIPVTAPLAEGVPD